VSVPSSETFAQTVYGEGGKTIQFMVWELVEIYSITDTDGNPYEAEGRSFGPDTLT
jgi:hypothetical protein